MKLTLEPTIDNAAGFAHCVDAISDVIETAITDGELIDTPPHTDSQGTCAPALSEPLTHQRPCEKTSTAQHGSKTRLQRSCATHSRQSDPKNR
jgi:hypothetical protein